MSVILDTEAMVQKNVSSIPSPHFMCRDTIDFSYFYTADIEIWRNCSVAVHFKK